MRRLMLLGLIMLMTVFALGRIAYAQVVVQDNGPVADDCMVFGNSVKQVSRDIIVRNESRVSYGFRYNYRSDPVEDGRRLAKPFPAHVRFPYIGDKTAGTSGLGLVGGGWYEGGFFDVMVNGKGLVNTLVDDIRVRSGKADGEVLFVWDPEWATIAVRCLFKPREEKVYMIIDVIPGEKVKEIGLKLVAYPGGDKGQGFPHDRWACTATRNIQHGQGAASLNPESEYWAYCFDSGMNERGSCAVIFLPEEIKDAKVDASSNATVTLVGSKMKFSNAFWHHVTIPEPINMPRFKTRSLYRARFGNCQTNLFWPPSMYVSVSISTSRPLTSWKRKSFGVCGSNWNATEK